MSDACFPCLAVLGLCLCLFGCRRRVVCIFVGRFVGEKRGKRVGRGGERSFRRAPSHAIV